MKKKHLLVSMMFMAGVLAVWSCKKDEDKTVTKEDAVSIAKNDAVSDKVYNEIYAESEEVLSALENGKYPASSGSLKSASLTGTRMITVTKNSGDSTVFPKEISIIYSNYVSYSGIKKNGTIKITQSARIRKVGAIRTVTLENFSLNDTIRLEGKKTITNKGLVEGKPTIEVKLSNGKVTFESGNYLSKSFTRTITWVEGFDTPLNIWNDSYSIEETAQGTSKSGLDYNAKTTEALIYRVSDFCIKKGKIAISIEGKKTVYLDFARTACAEKIKLTFEGDPENFNL